MRSSARPSRPALAQSQRPSSRPPAGATTWRAAREDSNGRRARRDHRLGLSGITTTVGLSLAAVSEILLTIYYSRPFVPGGYTVSFGIGSGGELLLGVASSIAALAFLPVHRRPAGTAEEWAFRRDGRLGIAAMVAAGALLILCSSSALGAAAGLGTLSTGKETAADWLHAAQELGWSAAFACAGLGLLVGRRARSATPAGSA